MEVFSGSIDWSFFNWWTEIDDLLFGGENFVLLKSCSLGVGWGTLGSVRGDLYVWINKKIQENTFKIIFSKTEASKGAQCLTYLNIGE